MKTKLIIGGILAGLLAISLAAPVSAAMGTPVAGFDGDVGVWGSMEVYELWVTGEAKGDPIGLKARGVQGGLLGIGNIGVSGSGVSTGVAGFASLTTGTNNTFGGIFNAAGPYGRGVRGEGPAIGGAFFATGPNGVAVMGTASDAVSEGTRVGGYFVANGANGRGIMAQGTQYAGWFAGNVKVTGDLIVDGNLSAIPHDLNIPGTLAIQGLPITASNYAYYPIYMGADGLLYKSNYYNQPGALQALLDAQAASDRRLKKNIEPISDKTNVLGSLEKMRGVYFNWRTENQKVKDLGDKRRMGMIAQEVEEVFPELVDTGEDGYKTLAYQNMVGFLVEVNKEQQKEIKSMEARIKVLEEKAK